MTKDSRQVGTNKNPKPKLSKKSYDLEERISKFGEDIIEFAKKISKNPSPIYREGDWIVRKKSIAQPFLTREI